MREIKKQVVLITTLIFIFCGFSFGQGTRYTGSYTPSGAITWNGINNKEISGLSFTNIGRTSIELWECSNITIKNCKFSKSAFKAISAENSKNLTIEDCVFDSIDGIYAQGYGNNPFNGGTCSGIKIRHNYFKNTIGNNKKNHSVQFMGVNGGGGNQINNNSFEQIHGQSNVDDMVSLYASYGVLGDSIEVNNNWFRGGDYSTGSGIMTGDNGGSYAIVRGNIICNIVATGIGNAGGNNIKIENNICYQDVALAEKSSSGIFITNFTSTTTDCSSNTIRNNRVYYAQPNGSFLNYENGASCGSIAGWSTNITDPTLNASILPANIAKAKGVVTGTDPTSSTANYKIFPNPVFAQSIIITSENPGNEKISIYNLSGQTVVEKSINTTRTEINTSNLTTGIYVITISKDNTILEVRKIRV